MPIGSGKYYLDRSYAATFSVQRFSSDPASVTVTYGKQNVSLTGRGGAANPPFNAGGNFAGNNPPTGGNFASNNPPSPGNIATYNSPTPGTANFNPPVNGVNVNEFTQIFSNEIGFNSFNADLGFQTNPCPSPFNESFSTEFIQRTYSCPPATQPGNFASNNPPSPGTIATYNSPTPGTANFNAISPGTAFFNPVNYELGTPGNPTNATIPGYPTRVFPGATRNNTGFDAAVATTTNVVLNQEESRRLEGSTNPVSVGTGFGNTNASFRGFINVSYNAT
jgi:hypothetical protein